MVDTGDTRVRCDIAGHVAVITLARPDKLNALDMDMVTALERACRAIEETPDVRVAILTGEGDKAFSAGGDIEAWAQRSPLEFGQAWVRYGHRSFDALSRLRQPLIAVLNGHALGGGLELAACADFRIAEDHVRIGAPESGLGIIPGWSGTQRTVRRFGAQVVRRMAVLGETFTAEEALRLGLVDKVVLRGAGPQAAQDWAERMAARGPVATQFVKALINAAEGEDGERAIEMMAGAFAATTDDLKEGVAAFRAKRKPDFSGT
jgi:enoyl-CoA hydratase/carnithine racemase